MKKYSSEKNNFKNIYYNETNSKAKSSEKRNNLVTQRVNNKEENSLNIKPIENINIKTLQNRTILNVALSNSEQNKSYDNSF